MVMSIVKYAYIFIVYILYWMITSNENINALFIIIFICVIYISDSNIYAIYNFLLIAYQYKKY